MARVYTARPRRRHSTRNLSIGLGAAAAFVLLLIWWISGSSNDSAGVVHRAGRSSAEHGGPAGAASFPGGPVERGSKPEASVEQSSAKSAAKVKAAREAGERALEKDDALTAQVQLSAALLAGAAGEQADEIRAKLGQLGQRVVFSPGRISGDPRSVTYVVKRGDNLRKIAKDHKVTADLIAKVNNLNNKSVIREGARLKVPCGPFSAIVDKSQHTLDVLLGDVVVRSYKVGLGQNDSTPTGTWRVKNKLTNPTYFPPRGGQIVHADDPNNPLGEHWLGLEGVAGEAKDQVRYGIHGTNEPGSIGKDLSLGCIRLHNEDVAELYTLLVEGDSKVIIRD